MHKVQVGCADSNSRFVMTRAAVQSQASSKVARMNTGRVRRRRQIDDKCLDLRTGIVRSTGKASFLFRPCDGINGDGSSHQAVRCQR